jgi:hypothetical protein
MYCVQHYVVEYLGYHQVVIIQKTLENTSQLVTMVMQFPVCHHIKAWFPWLNCNWFRETVAMNTYFVICYMLYVSCLQACKLMGSDRT